MADSRTVRPSSGQQDFLVSMRQRFGMCARRPDIGPLRTDTEEPSSYAKNGRSDLGYQNLSRELWKRRGMIERRV